MVALGLLLFKRGDDDEAKLVMYKALEYEPHNVSCLAYLAVHELKNGKLQRAASLYRKMLKTKPEGFELHHALTSLSFVEGKLLGQ
jgi:cytochrome c-type biogenesis protein CcmH/NrfG